jgi:sugar lactone lactonase YvrE
MKATNHPSFISPKGRRMFKLIALLMLLLPFGKAGMGYAQIITTVAGTGTAGYSGDGGQASNAELYHPYGVTFDAFGNFYIPDTDNNRIRKVTTNGIITTFAGNGTTGTYPCSACYGGDGGQATAAELNRPQNIAIDVFNNVYIADQNNSRIRKVDTAGIITTIAGNGTAGYSGDGGQAINANLSFPSFITFDALGNLYIADWSNYCIRKVNTLGIIETVAGGGSCGSSYCGDGGQATSAEFSNPEGIAFDAAGNLYITDAGNNNIRMVNTSGIINTIAGNGTIGYSGDGGQATNAQLFNPIGVALDDSSNLYIADANNDVIRRVNKNGIITTIVGNGIHGYGGDGNIATTAELYEPAGVAIDVAGNLYIADFDNYRIRKVTNVGQAGIQQVTNINDEVIVYPNPAATSIQVSLAGNSEDAMLVIRDMLGNVVYHSTTNAQYDRIPIAELTSGMYIIEVSNSKGTAFKKFIKE